MSDFHDLVQAEEKDPFGMIPYLIEEESKRLPLFSAESEKSSVSLRSKGDLSSSIETDYYEESEEDESESESDSEEDDEKHEVKFWSEKILPSMSEACRIKFPDEEGTIK